MKPYDQIGNILAVGDLVGIQLGNQNLLARVANVNEPSVLAPGPNQMDKPGIVTFEFLTMSLPFNMKSPRVANVTKLCKPPDFDKPKAQS